ncbi:MAG: hypothetical protein IID44_04960 [Planctomycetes bacterium]|nr:hypothetical protein [Planctomycetota bacterium]
MAKASDLTTDPTILASEVSPDVGTFPDQPQVAVENCHEYLVAADTQTALRGRAVDPVDAIKQYYVAYPNTDRELNITAYRIVEG